MWSLSRLRSSFHGRSNSAASASPSASSKCSRRNPFGRSLRLEPLEDRRLLSVFVSGHVWNDLNRNGDYDPSLDPGIDDVSIKVYSTADDVIGNEDDVLQGSVTTQGTGYTYNSSGDFDCYCQDLSEGSTCYAKIVIPDGYVFAAEAAGGNAFNADGVTPIFTVSNRLAIADCNILLTNTSTSWSFQAGSTDGSSCGNAVARDADGNNYVAGYFSGSVDFDPGEGKSFLSSEGQHAFVAKYTTDGALVWATDLGLLGATSGIDIAIDGDGYVYTTGSYADDAGGGFFVSKLNAGGATEWIKTVLLPGFETGVDDQDTATAIAIGDNDIILVAGCFSGTVDFNPGSDTFNLTSAGDQDAFVLSLNSSGKFNWAIASGGTEADAALDLTGGSNTFVTGVLGNDCMVMKLDDNSGDVLWTAHTSGTGAAVGTSVVKMSTSGVFIAGYFQGTVDFNPGADEFNLVSAANGDYSVFILKLDSEGGFCWSREGISDSVDAPLVDLEWISTDSIALLYSSTSKGSVPSTDYAISYYLAKLTDSNGFGSADWSATPIYSFSASTLTDYAGCFGGGFAVGDDWIVCGTGTFASVAHIGIPSESFTSIGSQDIFVSQFTPQVGVISSFKLDSALIDNQQPAGTLIGAFSQVDLRGSTFLYSLVSGKGDSNNDCFYINGDQLKTTEKYSVVGTSAYSIRVRVTDEYGQWAENSFTITATDHAPPKVTINPAPEQVDPAAVSPIVFRVVFSEPVEGFTADDVIISGTAPGTLEASVAWVVYADKATYDVTIRGMTGVGTVVASIVAGAAHDAKGNLSLASTSTDNSILYTCGAAFQDFGTLGLPGVGFGSAVWGDYDNDGRLDILLAGFAESGDEEMITRVYHNDGNNTFHDIGAGLYGVVSGSLAWGDYDNDGRLDILMTGQHSEWDGTNIVNTTVTKLYHNDGNGVFTEVSTTLPPVTSGTAAWGDYDGDGRLDILLTGNYRVSEDRSEHIVRMYHNDGNGIFHDIAADLPQSDITMAAWGDYDGDGRLDLLANVMNVGMKLFHNDGNNIFSDVSESLGLVGGGAAWGDFNNDGLLDILMSQNENAVICVNNGDGTFHAIPTGLPAVSQADIAWGDYDGDGLLDFLVNAAGSISSPIGVKIYHNDGNGEFHALDVKLSGTYEGSAQWGDYNNDGRLDILVCGMDSSLTPYIRIYENNLSAFETKAAFRAKSLSAISAAADAISIDANTRPTAPTNLKAKITSNTSVLLSWDAATDAETSADGLTYSIRVGTTPGGCDVATATASASGLRRLAEQGAIEGTSWTLTGLKASKTYYWSVQAVDTSFAGSAFATEGKFTLVKPTFALTAPTSGTVTAGQSVTVAWTAGNVPAGSNVSLCYDKDTTFWNGNETWIEIGAVAAANGKATYTWNTTGVAPGTYYVGGYLWANGSPTWSHLTKSITIKAPPAPTFTLTAPTSGTVVAGKNATITWTAANVPAGSTVSLCYDTDTKLWNGNETWIEINKITAADGKGTYTWNTAGVAPGTYYIGGYLWANGKSTCSHLTKSITIQAGPTVRGVVAVEATEPRDKVLTTNESILMTWNAIDADGVAGSTLLVDGKNVAVKGPYRTTSGSNFSAKLGLLTAGVHTYSIVATDKLGYKTATPLTGTFTVTAALLDKAFASCLDEKEKDWWMA